MILNADQEYVVQKAVNWFKYSDEPLFQYDGPPGSGKSVVLYEIIRRLGLNIDTEVAPMSFIGAASLVMRLHGFRNAKTIHSWIYDLKKTYRKDENGDIMYKDGEDKRNPYTSNKFHLKQKLDIDAKLIVIDEAYCMPRSMRADVESFGIKILACGDANQLPPVNDYPAYLVDGPIYHLSQIMRQIGIDDIIYLANRATLGIPLLNGYYGNSLVIDRENLTDEMLLWADVVICGTNYTRDKLNAHIRYIKGYQGVLPNYGEKVVCRNNNWQVHPMQKSMNRDINLVNGMIGTVCNQPNISSYNPKNKSVQIMLNCDMMQDCTFFCQANYDYLIGDFATRNIIRKRPFGRTQLIEFAYAITCHIAQGSQFHKVIYIEEDMHPSIQTCLNLVGITRADQQLIYVNKSDNPNWLSYNNPSIEANFLAHNQRVIKSKMDALKRSKRKSGKYKTKRVKHFYQHRDRSRFNPKELYGEEGGEFD